MVAPTCNLSTEEAEAGGDSELRASLGYIVKSCLKKSMS
jgi:hypothetical protein